MRRDFIYSVEYCLSGAFGWGRVWWSAVNRFAECNGRQLHSDPRGVVKGSHVCVRRWLEEGERVLETGIMLPHAKSVRVLT